MNKEKIEISLETFVVCRLIPFLKKPGLPPIGLGEILQRRAEKDVMKILNIIIINNKSSLLFTTMCKSGG